MLTSLHPPVFPWGLLDCANKPPPSPLLGASQRFCSLGLLGKDAASSPSPSLRPAASLTREPALARAREGQRAQSTEPRFCKSQQNRNQIQICPFSAAILLWISYARANYRALCRKTNCQKPHSRALLQQINRYAESFEAAGFFFCGSYLPIQLP